MDSIAVDWELKKEHYGCGRVEHWNRVLFDDSFDDLHFSRGGSGFLGLESEKDRFEPCVGFVKSLFERFEVVIIELLVLLQVLSDGRE